MFLSILTTALGLLQQVAKYLTQLQLLNAGKAEQDDATRRANEDAIKRANAARDAQSRADAQANTTDGLRDDGHERAD
jgi:hypothetical protein